MAFTFGIVPVIFYPKFYSDNGVCVAYHYNQQLALVDFFHLRFSFYLILLPLAIKQSRLRVRSSQTRKDQDIAKILSLVVLSDFLCWIPIGIMGTMTLAGQDISGDVYAWVIVFVLPVNSALNPFLYTFSGICKKNKVAIYFDSKNLSNHFCNRPAAKQFFEELFFPLSLWIFVVKRHSRKSEDVSVTEVLPRNYNSFFDSIIRMWKDDYGSRVNRMTTHINNTDISTLLDLNWNIDATHAIVKIMSSNVILSQHDQRGICLNNVNDQIQIRVLYRIIFCVTKGLNLLHNCQVVHGMVSKEYIKIMKNDQGEIIHASLVMYDKRLLCDWDSTQDMMQFGTLVRNLLRPAQSSGKNRNLSTII
ncbi:hypothetical protein KUTeg_023229 [Tegillarca granosa]|uniref:G-protein coupled receptors family 1 profile domain-containing protein n=1 Tax=Tegillarca granosa TaxID=220873 RepID=A0ABQ9E1F2_TEGGR|nr:hypothetical protein KUTeg_023229 [Tegillarca granosa]